MAPKSPWKTNSPKTNWKNDLPLASPKQAGMPPFSLFKAAGNAPVASPAVATATMPDGPGSVNYSEVQADEIDALQSIFFDCYEQVEVKSAWNKTTDKAFRLKLASNTDGNTFVTLSVRLTATYPKTLPLLQVEGLENLHAIARRKIETIVHARPEELRLFNPGEAMIYTIADEIVNVLEDAVLSREQGVLPSLEDERMIQETVAARDAKEAEANEAKRNEAAQAERTREMNEKVQHELERRDKRQSRALRSSEVQSPEEGNMAINDDVQFDQVISLSRTDFTAFDTVTLVSTISTKRNGGIFAVKPKTPGRSSIATDMMLAVRQIRLTLPSGDNISWDALLDLEQELEQLKTIRSSSSINVYAFKIEKTEGEDDILSQDRIVSVLTDCTNRGNLAEMLEDNQTIPLHRARQWSLDLLEALDYYHRHGIVHKRIHTSNVLFFRSSAGVMKPKLADAGYEDRLLRLQGRPSAFEKGKKMAAWLAPEITTDINSHTRRSDVWDFGVLLIQMLFGITITRKHPSPASLIDSLRLSEPLEDLLRKVFSKDSKARPSAFDLLPSEFFRSEIPLMSSDRSTSSRQRRQSSSYSNAGHRSPILRRSRQNSTSTTDAAHVSRYMADFTELGRLGKGGFGEVVKARHRMDGGVYAVKKVKQKSQAELQQVLSEVMILHRLNHPFVVRYYSTWVEEDFSHTLTSVDEDSMAESFTASGGSQIEFAVSSRGLDFVSSQGFNIEFGEDTDEEDNDDDGEDDEEYEDDDIDDDETNSGTETRDKRHHVARRSDQAFEDSGSSESSPLEKVRSGSRRIARSTLYITMEFCEGSTLRDLIKGDMHARPQEAWKMLRQILEGLAFVHSHGIIHRDLKPDNIFIDEQGNPRIGDFGLATTSRNLPTNKILASTNTNEDMTRSVGTALYVAPEIKSQSGKLTGSYTSKVDMYSLGIIFFEMCYALSTAMERHQVLTKLREAEHVLPPVFLEPEKLLQGSVILSLINHNPNERPRSDQLLDSGKLPVQVEDKIIREAMQGMLDSSSPYYQRMMTGLFEENQDQRVKALAWDARAKNKLLSAEELRAHDIARTLIRHVFHKHGAEETERPLIFDRSPYYTAPDVVRLLDPSGNLLQLPYDLTLPFAKQLAKQSPDVPTQRTFAFGRVFRDGLSGGPPKTSGVVNFDIVTKNGLDLALHDAECIKVLEEIIQIVPALDAKKMCFHLNHSDILELILDHCRIDPVQRPAVKEILSKLNIGKNTWQAIRAELRSPILAIHITSVDELAKFNFRETPEKIHVKLQLILEGSTQATRIRRPLEQLSETIEQMRLMGIERKVYISPLSCYNDKFYAGGILFQCVFDQKEKRVFAAGGRYDSLIKACRPHDRVSTEECHAVGVNIGWETIIKGVLQDRKSTSHGTHSKKTAEGVVPLFGDKKRVSILTMVSFCSTFPFNVLIRSCPQCDILVASADTSVLHSAGVKLLSDLWSADLSAELADDAEIVDNLLSRQVETTHSWVVVIKHDGASTLKVWNTLSNTETEIASTNVVQHIRAEIKERESGPGVRNNRHPMLIRQASHHTGENEKEREKTKANVQVLLAQHKSKKGNKYHIITAANDKWNSLLDGMRGAPILALETRDDVLELVREARLSDGDSWKKVIQRLPVSERQYLGQAQDVLEDMKKKWMESEGERLVGVFNFRSGACIPYDVGA